MNTAPSSAPGPATAPYLTPDQLAQITSHNTSFSTQLPGLQLAWDSTSLGLLKECPYKYYLSIVLGHQPRTQSVHLTFGLHYHAALELYDHERLRGADHEAAVQSAVLYALRATWDKALGRPWSSDHDTKNRFTLIRTIVWYLEQFQEDSLQTVVLANGKPAVELSFRFDTDYHSGSTGETFLLSGHLDRLVLMGEDAYVADRKTTGSTLSAQYFAGYSPDNQMTLYNFAGRVVYSVPVKGVIVDAAQIAVTFSRFERSIIPRPPGVIEEWYTDLGQWLGLAELFALQNRWPRNEKSCGAYGGCAFRGVCSKSPAIRAEWLRVDFATRIWDPLVARGDI